MGKTIQLSGFPHLVTGDTVKEFLERHTGRGTVYALEVRKPQKSGSRVYAIVQFESARYADQIISLAAQRLYYGSSYLKAYAKDFDLVQNPKLYVHEMESITLYFGCQISKEKFSVLWEREDISVKFGLGLRKLYFFLSDHCVDYKLELFYENIWQIELHRPLGQTSKFLLIQLLGAPRIYKKCAESCLSYFKETPEENWVRATDFTPSNSIGQSSALCLGISYGVKLLNFSEYFPYFKESERPFILRSGSSFSRNLDLVPIVGPAHGLYLPYRILFKICILVQQGCLSGPTLDINFFRSVDPRRIHITFIEDALEKLYHLRECCYEPVTWLGEQYQKYIKLPKTPAITLDDGLVYIHRVQVTPCKVYFCGPEVNMSNRVLRQYPEDIDNFLRVSFVDEELGKLFSTDLLPRVAFSIEERRTGIYRRILSILRDGIVIGDKKFDFLAFSSSQLRENSAWMFASRAGLTAADIRKWMGDFRQIRNVAKYATRLGQSFSSSRETLSVGRHEREMIPDVAIVSNGIRYVFSDGIGKISTNFARRVAKKCGIKNSIPSAFQIRYGGYKGVVAVDPASTMKISLREIMLKYDSENKKLDVLAWSKYQPCYLNRQLITLLSTLGVMDNIFEKKQKKAVEQLDSILTDPSKAQEALELMAPGENTDILKEMLLGGYRPDAEPFLSMMLQTFRATKLLEIRTKTRVYVPGGRSMMGCLDETKTLEYGQVFVQISRAGHALSHDSDQGHRIVVGNVFVAKNPCLHPGDIRVLRAVNVPALYHMVDCVVFPQKGMRPHPDECSGNDLDGDIYFVCWDQDLIPPLQIQPMDYSPALRTQLDHDVSIEEVVEYFANYIVNDSLGIISNAHIVFADREPGKAMSDPCLKLAKLFSIAVDFPKTGVSAEIPRDLRVQDYPDFMEKPDKTCYRSESVIGKLFRAVKDIAPHSIKSFTWELAWTAYDYDMEVDGFEDYLEEAFDCKTEYDYKLGNLMDYYGIKTEAEILGGSILKMSKSFNRRKDAKDVGLAVKSLRKEARTWFKDDENADIYAKASAWYYVTYHHSYWGSYNVGMKREHFISFPWCVYDKLMYIKRNKSSIRRAHDLSSLEDKLKYGVHLS